jgi:hypothetical protein
MFEFVNKSRPRKKTRKTRLLVIRVNENDYARIFDKAQAFANGNLSVWVRYAAIMLEPPKFGEKNESRKD